ncbi:MAG: MFS transporter [Planctomycetaceae bacterium]
MQHPSARTSDSPNGQPTHVRWVVLIFLALAAAGAYLTRNCISVTNIPIQKELSLDDEQMGWVLGIFSLGYFVFQVPGGWLGNRFGTRIALAGMNFAWSLFTILSAVVYSFYALLFLRILYGLAQAGFVPVSGKIVRDWFPEERRGFSSSVIGASMSAGGAIATALTGALLVYLGWREIFFLYSSVGMVWAVCFYFYFRTYPEEHPQLNQAELQLIKPIPSKTITEQIKAPSEHVDQYPPENIALRMLQSKSMWGSLHRLCSGPPLMYCLSPGTPPSCSTAPRVRLTSRSLPRQKR